MRILNTRHSMLFAISTLLALLLWPGGAAIAAVTFQTFSTAQNSAATTLIIAKPAGVAVDDFLLAQITFEKGSDINPLTPPGGWTLVRRDNRSSDIGQAIYYKFAVASDLTATQYTWTFSQTAKAAGGILRYTGVDPSPIVVSSGNSGESNPLTAPTVTAVANSKLVAFFGVKKPTTLSIPTSMTGRYIVQNPQDISSRAADQDVGAGDTGNKTSTAGSVDKWIAQLVVLRSAPVTQPLQVAKTVETTFTRTFNWTIDKSVDPTSLDLFRGDSGSVDYTVTLTKSDPVDAYAVGGIITITNPNASIAATITGVTDLVSPSINAAVNCGTNFPHTLAGSGVLSCTYNVSLPDGTSRTNTATVTASGAVAGASSSPVDVTFGAPTLVVNDSVTVTDSSVQGSLGPFSANASPKYSQTFKCDTDEGDQGNTAKVVGDGNVELDSASASVEVICYELEVAKTAATSFTRTWTWEIEKSSDVTEELTLESSESYEVKYGVTVDAEDEDSEHAVSGTITISNSAPIAASITDVTDQVNGTAAVVACQVNFPHALSENESLICTYTAELEDDTAAENTATVTIANGTKFEDTVSVTFGDPTTEVDKCVKVSDSKDTGGLLPDNACAPDPAPFEYVRFIGPFAQCGEQQAINTAAIASLNEDTELGQSTHTINVTVVGCEEPGDDGCTLSQGYWKTHSSHGPAPYDATWAGLVDTTFYSSGKTHYQVLWTPPAGGNAYYILAHQYIAAKLNELNGANFADAQSAYGQATTLFGAYTPSQVAGFRGNHAVRKQFIDLAGILGSYNSGSIGPGHCSEDETSP